MWSTSPAWMKFQVRLPTAVATTPSGWGTCTARSRSVMQLTAPWMFPNICRSVCVCVCGGGLSAVTAGIPTVPQMNSVGACVSVSLDCPLTAVRVWYGSVQHLEYLTDRPSGDLNPNRLHSKTSAKQVCLGVEGLEYRPRLSGGLNPNPSTPRQTQQTHLLFAEVPRVHWIQYLPIVVCARIDGVSKQRPPD